MYKDVKQFILNIPKFVRIPFNNVDISLAIDMYNRFYKPLEDFVIEEGTENPSLFALQNAVDYIVNFFNRGISSSMIPCLDHVSDLLFYRLLFRLNEQTREIIEKEEIDEGGGDGTIGDDEIERTDGDYHDILENVKNRYSKIYDFLGIDITFEEIALL